MPPRRNRAWGETWANVDALEIDEMLMVELGDNREEGRKFAGAFRRQNQQHWVPRGMIVVYRRAAGKAYIIRAK